MIMTSQIMKLEVYRDLNQKTSDSYTDEIERTNTKLEKITLRTGKDLTSIYNKSDVTLFACIFETIYRNSL